jgi:hypothetical protein
MSSMLSGADLLRLHRVMPKVRRLVRPRERQHTHLLVPGIAGAPDRVLPVAEHLGRRAGGAREEVHRVEAAHERGRTARGAGRDEFLLDQ